MLRLLAGDSSISARMARKSSLAETTGKSMTNKHPSASRPWHAVNLRVAGAVLASCHSQKAGSAKSNQARLSSNSIKKQVYAHVLQE